MKLKIYWRILLVVLISLTVTISPLTTKAQDDSIIQDSIMTLVPLDILEYGNFQADPIGIVGEVVVLKNNFHQFLGITEFNDIKLTAPIWGINLKTGKVLINNVKTSNCSYGAFPSKTEPNVFYTLDESRHTVFKVTIEQDFINYDIAYHSNNGLINTIYLQEDNTLYVAISWQGIKIVRNNKVTDSLNFVLDVYSIATKGDIIYFGGTGGVLGFIINGTGEIISLQNNMAWIGEVVVYEFNSSIYTTGRTYGGKYGNEFFKLDFDNKTWNKVTEENIGFIEWDNMYKKYTTYLGKIENRVFFEINDSFITIPKHPYQLIMTPEKFRNTQYEYYNENIGRIALGSRAIFEFDGKTYGIGWGIIGTYEMVSNKEEDTTGNVHASEQKLENVSLYPNPAKNIITIPNLIKEVEVSVYNVGGQLVLLQKSSGLVDISTLNPGLYLIRINGYKPEKFYKN